MAQILINIPDFLYKQILKKHVSKATIARAFQNGAILPKGHGRLIDADELDVALLMGELYGNKTAIEVIQEAPTIIEADKERE